MWPTAQQCVKGPLELITAPTDVCVTVEQAKAQTRVDVNVEDSYLKELVWRATEYCQESILGNRQFLTATFDLPLASWWCDCMTLPRPPLQSVTSVTYYDSDGNSQVLSSSYYEVRKPWKQPGYIHRAPNYTWPTLQGDRPYPIVIRFVAGFSSAYGVPHDWKAAVLLLVGHWYEHREAASDEEKYSIPLGVDSLLANAGWGSYA